MNRVRRSTAVATLPAPPAGGTPGYFTGGNPGLGQAATVPGYEWFNAVQEELIALILRGGLSPSSSDLAQVRKSLDRLFGGNSSYISINTTLSYDQAGLVLVDAAGGPRTITLPSASTPSNTPVRFRIVKIDASANAVTVLAPGETISANNVLSTSGAMCDLIGNGYNSWWSIYFGPPTTTQGGSPRFATAAETAVGTLADVAVTPAGLGAAFSGMIAYFPATAAPSGWLKANGALVSRATFFNLWAVAQASGNLVTDAAWVAANGPTGAFSQGDGSTTFRIPDLRGEFLRGWDDGRGVDSGRGIGSAQGDAIRNLTGSFGGFRQALGGNLATASGVFSLGATAASNDASSGSSTVRAIDMSAANQVPTAAENRPRNIALLPCIKF